MTSSIQNLNKNPFYHVVGLSLNQWIVTLTCGVLLVPLRLAVFALFIIFAWIPYCICLVIIDPNKPISSLERVFLTDVIRKTFSIVLGICVRYEGKECDVNESRIIVAAPHTSAFEFLGYSQGQYLCAGVAAKAATTWFIVGKLFKRLFIIVDKFKTDSRRQAKEEIVKWFQDREINPELVPEKIIFSCEGWYTNGSKLLPFKNGAFTAGRPIQVVTLTWEGSGFVPITTYGQNISWFWTGLLLMAQPYTTLISRQLPVYHPNEGEKSDPDIYADNVAALISKETGIPLASEGVSAIDYLEEIQKAREAGECAELATTGWKKFFSCRSERQSPQKAN